jgi:hypothetical protein
MKFEKGDKVICVDNLGHDIYLSLYKTYIIKNVYYDNSNNGYLLLNELLNVRYSIKRFISLCEFRRLKIQKIKDEIQKR